MATTGAERAKKSRERLLEQLGLAGLKERDHQKYLLKKERAKKKRELEKALTFHERMKLFILFRDLKYALRPQFLSPSGEIALDDKKKLDSKASELLKTLIRHRSVVNFSVLQELLQQQNLFPELDHAFFLEVSDKLNGEDAELWECLYFRLYYAEQLQFAPHEISIELGKMVDRDPQNAWSSFTHLCKLGALISSIEPVKILSYSGPTQTITRGKAWLARANEFPKCSLTAILSIYGRIINTVLLPDGKCISDIVTEKF